MGAYQNETKACASIAFVKMSGSSFSMCMRLNLKVPSVKRCTLSSSPRIHPGGNLNTGDVLFPADDDSSLSPLVLLEGEGAELDDVSDLELTGPEAVGVPHLAALVLFRMVVPLEVAPRTDREDFPPRGAVSGRDADVSGVDDIQWFYDDLIPQRANLLIRGNEGERFSDGAMIAAPAIVLELQRRRASVWVGTSGSFFLSRFDDMNRFIQCENFSPDSRTGILEL